MKSLLKIIVILFLLPAAILYIKTKDKTARLKKSNKEIIAATKAADNTIFLVGSSRVLNGINDSLINSALGDKKVFNCGISASTLFSNCVLAEGLIKKAGHKIILIELSPLIMDVPSGVHDFMEMAGLGNFSSVHWALQADGIFKQRRAYLDIWNKYLVNSITLEDEIKFLINIETEETKLSGFKPLVGNGYRKKDAFLEKTWLYPENTGKVDVTLPLKYINHLASFASRHQSKVIFFLPLVYKRRTEKEFVSAIFHRLPDSMKLNYPESLLEQMSNPDYLYDINHLNETGANKFSELLVPLIDSLRSR